MASIISTESKEKDGKQYIFGCDKCGVVSKDNKLVYL